MHPDNNKNFPVVYVIVLYYNGCADTLECVQSLLTSDYPGLQLVLVDNASTDASTSRLRARFPQLPIIENDRNLGFAAGNNIGIKYALENAADYVLLANNDIVVESGTISMLVKWAESDANIGAVAPKIIEYHHPGIISFAGGRIHLRTGATEHIGQGEIDDGQYDTTRECDYLTGAFLLIKRQVLATAGLLPEIYFMYWEDADWCLGVRQAGYRLLYVPAAVIKHKVSASTRGVPLSLLLLEYRGARLFIKRWVKGPGKIVAHVGRFIYLLRRIFYSVRLKLLSSRDG